MNTWITHAITNATKVGAIGMALALGIVQGNRLNVEPVENPNNQPTVTETVTDEPTELAEDLELPSEPEVVDDIPAKGEAEPAPAPKTETKVTASGSSTADSHVSGGIHDSNSPNFVAYKYSYIGDFEDAYLGYCAKDVPDGMWPEDLQPSVALGIKSVMDRATHNSIKGQMAYLFNAYVWEGGRLSYSLGNTYDFGPVEWFGIKTGYENQLYKPSMSFVITWSTRTISVTEPASQLPEESIIAAKKWAEEATAYLRWLDSAYKQKCGAYKSLY